MRILYISLLALLIIITIIMFIAGNLAPKHSYQAEVRSVIKKLEEPKDEKSHVVVTWHRTFDTTPLIAQTVKVGKKAILIHKYGTLFDVKYEGQQFTEGQKREKGILWSKEVQKLNNDVLVKGNMFVVNGETIKFQSEQEKKHFFLKYVDSIVLDKSFDVESFLEEHKRLKVLEKIANMGLPTKYAVELKEFIRTQSEQVIADNAMGIDGYLQGQVIGLNTNIDNFIETYYTFDFTYKFYESRVIEGLMKQFPKKESENYKTYHQRINNEFNKLFE